MATEFDPAYEHLFDLGAYDPHEHLDVPEGASVEETAEFDLAENVHDGIHLKAATRLHAVFAGTTPEQRKEPHNLTQLGSALHTIQDYFSHTNHVELLLWHLSEKGKLPKGLVASFNSPISFLDPAFKAHKRTVLRGYGESNWRTSDQIYFPYRSTVGETLVTSGLFERLDTVWSMLSVYRRQLLGQSAGAYDDDMVMDLVFGLVDFPREKLARTAIDVASDFGDVISSIGQTAREAIGTFVENRLIDALPEHEDDIKLAANLKSSYDSQDASKWARASRIAYLQKSIEKTLLKKYDGYDPDQAVPIPNHTLLNKDYQPERPADMIRFNLCCWLATRVSEELLTAYFDGESSQEMQEILQTYVVHPVHYADTFLDEVEGVVSDLYVASWRQLSL